MWIGRADPSRSTQPESPGLGCLADVLVLYSVLSTCIQLSGLIKETGTEYRYTTCLVPSFFSLHLSAFHPPPYPCTSTPPTHLPSGGSERGTDIPESGIKSAGADADIEPPDWYGASFGGSVWKTPH